jgi:hypothetical protein
MTLLESCFMRWLFATCSKNFSLWKNRKILPLWMLQNFHTLALFLSRFKDLHLDQLDQNLVCMCGQLCHLKDHIHTMTLMDNEQHIVLVLDDRQHQIALFKLGVLVEPEDTVLPI